MTEVRTSPTEPLSWLPKTMAIVFGLLAFRFWIGDFMLHGSLRQAGILAVLWLPALLLLLWAVFLWDKKGWGADRIRSVVRRIFFVLVWLGIFLAILTMHGDIGNLSGSVFGNGWYTGILEFYVAFVLPVMTILLPVYVLDFWKRRGESGVIFFWITFIGFLFSSVAISSIGDDFLRSQNDPCYEVVEGKSDIYHLKGDRVCVMYYETALGASYFKTLDGADLTSFEEVGYSYAKDGRHVYRGEEVVDELDPQTFRHLGNGYYVDKGHVFCASGEIVGADPLTFTVLPGNYYTKDGSRAYYSGEVLEGVDVPTFQSVKDIEYAWDMNHVYYADRVIPGADPKSFHFLEPISFYAYTYDADQVFAHDTWLQNLDATDFRRVGSSEYLRDDDSLYYMDSEVIGVDIDSFQTAPIYKKSADRTWSFSRSDCGTDGKVVVCYGKILEGEDPNSYFLMTDEEKKHIEKIPLEW